MYITRSVSRSQIDPKGSGRPEHSPNLAEYGQHFSEERLQGALQADLAVNTVIAQAPVRRAGDNAVNRFIGKRDLPGIGLEKYYAHAASLNRTTQTQGFGKQI